MATAQKSADKAVPAIKGENTAGGVGTQGVSQDGRGVEGTSTKGVGVVGISKDYRGIEGRSTNEHAILGRSTKGSGVVGISENNRGVHGRSTKEHGVFGESAGGAGVAGFSEDYRGIHARSKTGQGVWAESDAHEAVHAETKSESTAAIAAHQLNEASPSAALFARHAGRLVAGRFEGDVEVTGDIRIGGADLAEQFGLVGDAPAHPGTVMVLAGTDAVAASATAYDRRVAGVVSGGGSYRPGLVLEGGVTGDEPRQVLALAGKVWLLADATKDPIRVGDLLTTSDTPGHAMRASDLSRTPGAVLGKALDDLPAGLGLIRALIALG